MAHITIFVGRRWSRLLNALLVLCGVNYNLRKWRKLHIYLGGGGCFWRKLHTPRV